MMSSCSAFRRNDGTINGAVIVFSDLTTLKQLEAEKRRAERLAALGALASGLAHEIKNPLVAIRTFAELLPERFSDPEFRESFSQVALTEIERIDHLVARLRGFVVPATNTLAPLDLRDPIEDTLILLRAQLEQKRITLTRNLGDISAHVAGDLPQLKQLFLNILLNSLEAMEPGGTLTVRLTRHPSPEPPHVSIEISDSGHGIQFHVLSTLFDPFVTTKPNGTGLGLALCRGIADAHGATIRAQNNRDRSGATIILTFPLIDTPAQVLAP
jgi:signal transduction histidine kinase